MSALLEAQKEFAQDAARLVLRAAELGLAVTLGEVLRPRDLQNLYIQTGRSWAPNSRHLDKLAIDLQLFRGDKYLTDEEEYAPLGTWWEELRPGLNKWGASSGRPRKDANHFERRRP
jgi:hypothetical protein